MTAMSASVSNILERRRTEAGRRGLGRALGLAAFLHVLVVTLAWALPHLLAAPPKPVEYVAVQIVPAARLGVETPKPVPPRPAPEKKPDPKPPEPESKAPVLPDPKAKKVAKPEPKAAEPETPTSASAPADAKPEVQGRAGGTAAGLSLGAAVAGLDNPNFTYGYYVDQMLALISRNWVRPPVGSGIEATVHYRIQRDGKITELRIVSSSGINSFDLAALRAVQASSPLPPLPRGFRDSSLGVNLIVR
ncbi:MAG: TonB C-terminal domain-containing protein [Holophagales bacterium]|nr:TonB C-terminal domain-containing protein [Holophagales bacterium]